MRHMYEVLYTGLFLPLVILTFDTCKRFRQVLNLPKSSFVISVNSFIFIHSVLNSPTDNMGVNKTGANISLYTVFSRKINENRRHRSFLYLNIID